MIHHVMPTIFNLMELYFIASFCIENYPEV